VERRRGSTVASFLVEAAPEAGSLIPLPLAALAHARVRRVAPGSSVRLTDGAGRVGWGTVERLDVKRGEVRVERTDTVVRPVGLTLLVPVADRERMLWLAEKAAEFGVTDWRPVRYARSRSVSPRGEGPAFERKVRGRMAGALEQSGGAWLPVIHDVADLASATTACAGVSGRYVLDPGGPAMLTFAPFHAAAVAVGPEGGLEPGEFERLAAQGWRAASLGGSTLRFETAGLAALAIIRSDQGR
jgi:16S rRNA (uracil1498-N3)-methyltransferase